MSQPIWPYPERTKPSRNLAILDPRDDWETIKADMFRKNQLLLTDSLQLYLEDALLDPRCDPWVDSELRVRGLCIYEPGKTRTRGRSRRWIIPSDVWGYAEPSGRMLAELRGLFRHMEQGDRNSPSALGAAVMAEAHHDSGQWIEYHCGECLQRHMRRRMCGGRADFIREYKVRAAWLYDLSNAYAVHHVRQPSGTATRVFEHEMPECATWFRQAWVRLPHNVALGPFPVRLGQDDLGGARIGYPRDSGYYGVDLPIWLWKEQGSDVESVGGQVHWGGGWYWRRWSDQSLFTERVIRLRQTAPTPEIEALVKNCIVASIGRHGMRSDRFVIVPDGQHSLETDQPLGGWPGCPQPAFWTRPKPGWHGGSMIHWFAYTIMQTARSLWGKALPVAEGRSLLATDYDAIYSLERYPAGSGWKEEKITDVSIRANRHAIYRDEQGRTKARLPGIPSWDTAQRTIGGGA